MPIFSGPYWDPEEDNPPRRRKAPKALARLRRQFTQKRQLAAFREVFHRDPASDDEIEAFAEQYILEVYNSGDDEL